MDDTFQTQSLWEAAYLIAKGFNLAGKDTSSQKVTILFKCEPNIEEEVVKFYNGARIEAKKFSDGYRTIKDFVFTR